VIGVEYGSLRVRRRRRSMLSGQVASVRSRLSSSAAIWAKTVDLAARMPVTRSARRVMALRRTDAGTAAVIRSRMV
jgi:hypothetical protein